MKLLALFPDPNVPDAVARQGRPGSWTGGTNYNYQYSVPNDTNSWDVRVDHNLSANHRIFGRYSDFDVNRQDPPWTSNVVAGNGNFATQYDNVGRGVALAWSGVLSPSMLNELRWGYNQMDAKSNPIGLTMGKSLAPDYGLSGIPETSNTAGIPPINVSGLQRLGSSPWRPQSQLSKVQQILDSLSWLRGNHSFKFGYAFAGRAPISWTFVRPRERSRQPASTRRTGSVYRISYSATCRIFGSPRRLLWTITRLGTASTLRTAGA